MSELVQNIAKELSNQRARIKEADRILKEEKEKESELEEQLIEAFVDDGINSISIDGIGLFSLKTRNFLSVTAANKESFYEYLKSSGNGGLLKLDVNPRTLTSFLGEHLEELINHKVNAGLNPVDARNEALQFLNTQGASYFTKREIAYRSK